MTLPTSRFPVRFLGKHPIFEPAKKKQNSPRRTKSTRGVKEKESPYYWWWSALKLSEDYEHVCEHKGRSGKPMLRNLYSDFGDVRGSKFQDWWRKHGAILFGEPPAPDRVTLLDANDLDQYRDALEKGHIAIIAIPLHWDKSSVSRALKDVLTKTHPHRKRGRPSKEISASVSGAKYKLLPYK